ncbi:hypothetical protein Tco_0361417 [Tanacetum coccineum]
MNLHVPQEDSKEWDDQQLVVKLEVVEKLLEDEEVYLVDGVLEGALGALDLGNGSSSGGHECVWLLMMIEGDGELVLCIWREFMGRDLLENGMNLDKFREFQMLLKHSG